MIDEYHTQNWFQSVTMDCWTDQNYTQHVMTAHGKAGAGTMTNWLAYLLGGQSSSVHHQDDMFDVQAGLKGRQSLLVSA